MTISTKPILAVTMGDPAGTGPELIAKAVTTREVLAEGRPVVIGDAEVMRAAVKIIGGKAEVRSIDHTSQAGDGATIDVIDLKNVRQEKLSRGVVSADAG